MSDSTKSIELSNLQRIFLVILSLILALLFFAFKISFAGSHSLDKLARKSIDPEIALSNGRPTIFEFYADWCEVCQEMTPAMIKAEQDNPNKLDIVLLNVDNERWLDLIDKYEVNGIPQLSLFDKDGQNIGKSIGLRSPEEIEIITESLAANKEINDMSGFTPQGSINMINYESNINNFNLVKPMSHG